MITFVFGFANSKLVKALPHVIIINFILMIFFINSTNDNFLGLIIFKSFLRKCYISCWFSKFLGKCVVFSSYKHDYWLLSSSGITLNNYNHMNLK